MLHDLKHPPKNLSCAKEEKDIKYYIILAILNLYLQCKKHINHRFILPFKKMEHEIVERLEI